MSRVVAWAQAFALSLGAPGLFIIALLDSSFLSLPEIADLLVVWMVVQHKERLVLYAASATAGSLCGCLALYFVGRKGGEALVRKRFRSSTADSALAAFQRHGVMAVLIPSILPPPAPFKIFVLLAGVAGISVGKFSTAIIIGRGARYFVEGLLAVWYGEQAMAYIQENGARMSLWLVGGVVVAFGVYLIWRRMRSKGTVQQ